MGGGDDVVAVLCFSEQTHVTNAPLRRCKFDVGFISINLPPFRPCVSLSLNAKRTLTILLG